MKIFVIIIFCLVSASKNTTARYGTFFFDLQNFSMLDISGFKSKTDYILTTNIPPTLDQFVYNIGNSSQSACDKGSIACIKYKKDSKLYGITPASDWDSKNTQGNISFINNMTMTFTLPRSKRSIGPQKEFPQLIMKFICDKSNNFSLVTFLPPYYYILEIHNSTACQKTLDLSKFLNLISSIKYVIAPVIIILGAVLLLFGLRFVKVTLFMFGFLIVFTISLIIFAQAFAINQDMTTKDKVISYIVSFIISTIVGILCWFLAKFGIALLGASIGANLFAVLYNIIFHGAAVIILYIGMSICGIATGFLAFIYFDHVVIVTTAIVGSYLFIRGISIFTGGFPSEIMILDMIDSGVGLGFAFYVFLLLMIAAAVLSVLFQERFRSVNKEDYEKQREYLGLTSQK